MRYSTVLLDADETLLDFCRAEEKALRNGFQEFGLAYGAEVHPLYHEINRKLWHAFSMGQVDKQTLTVQRFEELFRTLGVSADPAAFKECYEGWLAKGYDTLPGAKALLQRLREMGCTLYCVTNGLKRPQFSRLTGSGLLPYFEQVFVSEEAGSQKPQKAYFDYVFAHLAERDRSKILLVGDSLSTDIAGGQGAGIDTVWFNPTGSVRAAEDPCPTYEVSDLADIPGIVGEK